MQKTYVVNGLDCPNCAARLEKNINKIDGVNSAVVSFATGKLILDADESRFEAVVDEAVALAKKLEPDWEIVR